MFQVAHRCSSKELVSEMQQQVKRRGQSNEQYSGQSSEQYSAVLNAHE